MNLVALDTSTEACSVALYNGTDTISRYVVEPRAHARLLLPMLDELLDEFTLRPAELDAVAFARGPGAFTGVRIATAAAQAIAMAADLPVVPVSTLATIAQRAFRESGCRKIAVAIDARMNEVYWGAYSADQDEMVAVGSERVVAPHDVPRLGADWIAAGTGWQVWQDSLVANSGVTVDPTVPALPHALDVLAIAQCKLARGETVTAEDALPVYLRDNVARTEAERAAGQAAL